MAGMGATKVLGDDIGAGAGAAFVLERAGSS